MVGAVKNFGAGRGSGTASTAAASCSEAAPEPQAPTARPTVSVTTNPRIRPDIAATAPLLLAQKRNLAGKSMPRCCPETTHSKED
jgi:hypothetical protein